MSTFETTCLKRTGNDSEVENGNNQHRRRYGHVDADCGATVDIPAVPGYGDDDRTLAEVLGQ